MSLAFHPSQICWHQLFEQQAAQLPDHLAVISNDQHLTYDGLNARANQLAHYLRALGAGPETLIPICVDRSLAMAVGILGILKAGAAYVPIDPAYPAERIEFMLADTAAPILVTQTKWRAHLPPTTARVVLLDGDEASIAAHSTTNPNPQLTADHLSYVIYTSGSTGKPKGTMLTQMNLSHYVLALQHELQLTPADRYLHLASIAFSSSRRHLLLPLAHGATVVIADEDQRLDPLPLFRLIQERGVTVFDAVPSFQRHCTNALLELNEVERRALLDNPLRLFLSASEPLLSDIPATWRREFQHPAQHIHMIGQTETSGIVALHRITDDDLTETVKVIPVGRPLIHTEIFLLDERQQPVNPGEAGEIYIRSAGVGRGYLNQAALTAERFLELEGEKNTEGEKGRKGEREKDGLSFPISPSPLLPFSPSRLCRTGDFARERPDGVLECLGRQDFQVKMRGQRVELGEIEALLIGHPGVRECVVMAREDVPGRKQLVAYVVRPHSHTTSRDELRELTARELPEYMQPAAFVWLDALPRTPNGKIDRSALPAPDTTAFVVAENYVAPRNPTEAIIAAIWAEVLGIERIGIDESFFALGGHSLLASQVIARVRAALQIHLPLRTIFTAPTIAGLAAAVTNHQAQTTTPLTKAAPREVWPLSFAQQRLWFLDQLEPNSATYNLSKVIRLSGTLDLAALQQAVNTIVARHDILRARFVAEEGQPALTFAAAVSVGLPLIDLCETPEAAPRIAAAIADTPFDLQRAPLLRLALLKLSDTEHQLVIVFHHIISDGWSMGIFLQELGALYQGQALPELPLQYADYAAWQQEQLQGEVLQEQLQFWKAHLADAPALLELPTDKPRPAVQRYRGSQISRALSAQLRTELQALSQREGVTLFMTLLAAWQVLLARYSQQEQIVLGTPIAGRTLVETEPLIGFFVNTLALRGDLSGNPTFAELLQRTRAAAIGAYTHQDVPFEKLVEELQPERSLSFSPLFQVMFALQNAPRAAMQWGEVALTEVDLPSQTAKFDLSLDVYETADGLEAWLEFDTDLFLPETAERLLQHWQTLLETVVANPAQFIQTLPLLTAVEEQRMLVEWNQVTVPVPPLCLHQLIEEHVAQTPENIAVVWQGESLSYGALNARANRVAHFLRQQGMRAESIVGICVERSLEMIVALLGVLKAGGAYLPLDPNYPQERLAHMLSDAQVQTLLTQESLLASLPTQQTNTICLDRDWPRIAAMPNTNPIPESTPDNLAYVIYTSGSTGQAKGVQVTHGNVVNALAAWNETYQLPQIASHLQMASFSFDVFTGDLTRALGSGAKLVLCPTEWLLEPAALYGLLCREQIEAAEFVPAVVRQLMDYLEETGQKLDAMKLVVVGSDTWQAHEYRRLQALCSPQTRVINSYGITEATIDSTYFEAANLHHDGPVPIGKPFPNTKIFILDAQQNPVPVGVTGELYIGGAGVARGYLNRAALTAERFLSIAECGMRNADLFSGNPKSEIRNPKLYKTGDLARFRPDGTIELIGRADTQIKLRGFRIELGEIEAALKQHPTVQDAVVIVREDEPGDKRLVAYLVSAGGDLASAALREYLRSLLPAQMIPSAFVPLERMPLTPNGKVDRKALPAPEGVSSNNEQTFIAPRTPTETLLARIWATVLKRERISVEDNFFDLGGHSLLATQVIARLRQACQIELPLRALFETPTLAGLAGSVAATIQAGRGLQAQHIAPAPGISESPQSYPQQRLWFLDQFDPGNSVYNLPVLLRVDGTLQPVLLEQSLNALIARHQILRTTFVLAGEVPVQQVLPYLTVAVSVRDLATDSEDEVQRIAQEEIAVPFALHAAPLLRATLLCGAANTQYLLLVMHHIISDGWSVSVLLQELGVVYQALLEGRDPQLPELPIQYTDYAAWQQEQLQGEMLQKQLQFWKAHLAGAPALLELPTDKPRPAVQRYRGAQVARLLPAALQEQLQALSQQAGVTLFMTLLAAWQVLLARNSGQDQIVLGTPIAGRTRVETEPLIGFFVNTLALRGDLSGNPTFAELLQRTRALALNAYSYQDLPFEKLVEELQPSRSTSYAPIFQVMFALQNAPRVTTHWGAARLHTVKVESHTAKFDLSLDVYETADGLEAWLEFDTDLFLPETATRMLQEWQDLLASLVENPAQRIHESHAHKAIARPAQPAPAIISPATAHSDEAPRTLTEETLAAIWADVLRVPRVGRHDDFFALGGHSLLAIKVISRIQTAFAVKLPVRNLFETSTVARLATTLDAMLTPLSEEADLDALLAELENLSEEDAERLLAEAASS